MEQRGENAGDEHFARHGLVAVPAAALVALHEARHREGHVEHVLDVVIAGVAGAVFGVGAGVHRRGVAEGALQLGHARAVEQAPGEADHLGAHRGGIGRPD